MTPLLLGTITDDELCSYNQEVETGEKVVNTRGLPEGKFTFTSHEAGDHTICLRSNYTGGWFSTPQVRMHLDIAVGEAKVDEEGEREHVKDLAAKVRDLNHRLADIRREQQFQREREAEFRLLSEKINSRAVWWSMFQMLVLGATCFWQLRHLRLFFESKKLYVFTSFFSLSPSSTDLLCFAGDDRGLEREGGVDSLWNTTEASSIHGSAAGEYVG